MRHVVCVNLAGIGYSTLAGDPSSGLELQSLGVATERVSERMLAMLHALHDVVQAPGAEPSVSLAHPTGERPLVCYGFHFETARDQLGREGLSFLHAIELDDVASMQRATLAVLELTAPPTRHRLRQEVARLALEPDEDHAMLKGWCTQIEERIHLSAFQDGSASPSVGRIVHDIAGAGPIACLALLLGQAKRAPGWTIREVRFDQTSATVVDPAVEGEEFASSLLTRALATALRGTSLPPESFLSAEKTVADISLVAPAATPTKPLAQAPAPRPSAPPDAPRVTRGTWLLAPVGAIGLLVGSLAGALITGSLQSCPEAPPANAAAPSPPPPAPTAEPPPPPAAEPPLAVRPVGDAGGGAAQPPPPVRMASPPARVVSARSTPSAPRRPIASDTRRRPDPRPQAPTEPPRPHVPPPSNPPPVE